MDDIDRQKQKLKDISQNSEERKLDIKKRLRSCLDERLTQMQALTKLELGLIDSRASSEDDKNVRQYEVRIKKNAELITLYKNMPDEDRKRESRIREYLLERQKELARAQE